MFFTFRTNNLSYLNPTKIIGTYGGISSGQTIFLPEKPVYAAHYQPPNNTLSRYEMNIMISQHDTDNYRSPLVHWIKNKLDPGLRLGDAVIIS